MPIKFLTKIKGYKQFGYFCVMTQLLNSFNFYIKSSVHAALAVTSLAVVTHLHFQQSIQFFTLCFIFSATLVTYNFIKYAVEAKYYFLVKGASFKQIQWFSFFIALVGIVSSFFISVNTLMCALFFGLMSLLYAMPLPLKHKNFRNQSGIKVFLVAFCWSGVSVVLPLIDFHDWNNSFFWLIWIQRFLLILIWMLPFEIRDLSVDPSSLNTIPQRIGVLKTKVLGLFLLVCCLFMSIIFSPTLLPDAAMILLTTTFLLRSKINQSPYFSSFWVESIPIFWVGMCLLQLYL